MSTADQKVLGYLGRALSLELTAVQMYSTQARLATNWGLEQAAERFQHESVEEMQHAERIITHMLSKNTVPGSSQLRPVKVGPDLMTLLQINQSFELELVSLYQAAVNYCAGKGLVTDRNFFHALLREEQQHATELSEWMVQLHMVANESR